MSVACFHEGLWGDHTGRMLVKINVVELNNLINHMLQDRGLKKDSVESGPDILGCFS